MRKLLVFQTYKAVMARLCWWNSWTSIGDEAPNHFRRFVLLPFPEEFGDYDVTLNDKDRVTGILATIITAKLDVMNACTTDQPKEKDDLAERVNAGSHIQGPFPNKTSGFAKSS